MSTDAGFTILTFDVRLTGWFANSAVTERIGWTVRLSFADDRSTDASHSFLGSVTFETLSTNASGFVVGWKTVGVGSARVSGTDILTLWLAFFSATNGRKWTICVLTTFHRLLASFAVWFTDCSGWTKTFVGATGVLTSSAGRARCLRAVIDWCTAGLNVTGVAWLAFADGLVFLRETERVLTAEILNHAGDFASIIVTAFIGRTFFVVGTFNLEATNLIVLGIAEKSFLATADGLTVDHFTGSVSAADDGAIARVATFRFAVVGFQAIFSIATFLVAATTNLLDADAVVANLSTGALRIFRTSWTTFAFDTML